MSVLEANHMRLPILSVNLAKLLTVVFQIAPGHIPTRKRPTYLMLATPWRAYTGSTAGTTWPTELTSNTGSLEDKAADIMKEYDSRIFSLQSSLPVMEFNRQLVQNCLILHPDSNIGDLFFHIMPAGKDVTNAETEYYWTAASTTDIYFNPAYGPPEDIWALMPLCRIYSSADGGIWHKRAISTDTLTLEYKNVHSGTAWVAVDKVTVLANYPFLASWYNMDYAIFGNAVMLVGWNLQKGYKTLQNPLPSEAAWNLRMIAFLLKCGAITMPMKFMYFGAKIDNDIAMFPPGAINNTLPSQQRQVNQGITGYTQQSAASTAAQRTINNRRINAPGT